MTVRLKRTAIGYATADGRWTVQAVTVGAGVNGHGGWSNGRRAWRLTDTSGQATLSQYGNRSQKTVDALWRARDIIGAHTRRETARAEAKRELREQAPKLGVVIATVLRQHEADL